jgi:hypothetical protein
MGLRQFCIGIILAYCLFLLLWAISYSVKGGVLSEVFVDSYWLLPSMGGVLGLVSARIWGVRNDFVGKSLLIYSICLILQGAGHLSYSIKAQYTAVQNPFPSIPEVFFLLSLLAMLVATTYMLRTFFIQVDQPDLKRRRLYLIYAIALGVLVSLVALSITGLINAKSWSVTLLTCVYLTLDSIFCLIFLFMIPFSRAIHYGVFVRNVSSFFIAFLLLTVADVLFFFEGLVGIWDLSVISDFFYISSYLAFSLAIYFLGFKFYRDHSQRILVLFSYTSLLTSLLLAISLGF